MIDGRRDPGEIDTILTDAGDIDANGNLDLKQAASDLQYSDYIVVSSPAPSEIEDALCGRGRYAGSNYVIAEVLHNGHQHFVVITGEALNPGNECDFKIADPSKADYTFLGFYTGIGLPVSIRVFTK